MRARLILQKYHFLCILTICKTNCRVASDKLQGQMRLCCGSKALKATQNLSLRSTAIAVACLKQKARISAKGIYFTLAALYSVGERP